MEGFRSIHLFKKYKAEQKAEIQEEKDKIEAERLETQKMMKELLEMKQQIQQSMGAKIQDTSGQ
jgi:signal peptidase I